MKVHGFVFMPNHVHLLITPAPTVSLEKALQFIKGGFSYRVHRELGIRGAIWNPGFNEHRIRDAMEFEAHLRYTHMNPVKAGRVGNPEDWHYSSARLTDAVDPAPDHFRDASAEAHLTV
jgi:putative transposase